MTPVKGGRPFDNPGVVTVFPSIDTKHMILNKGTIKCEVMVIVIVFQVLTPNEKAFENFEKRL